MPQAAHRSHTSSNAQRGRRRLRAALAACAAAWGAALLAAPAQAAPASSGASTSGASTSGADASNSQQQGWVKAYAQGQWAAAIELLETIPEGSRTAWHWLHLARALESSSQLVESFAAYERVHELAADGAEVVGMREVARQARAESNELARRIPWAEVSLAQALPAGALVFVDQQWLEPTRMRSPYPVNPGWHTFLVESNGEVLAARRAFFEEGQTRRVPLLGAVADTALDSNVATAAPAVPSDGAAPAAPGDAEAPRPRSLGSRSLAAGSLGWPADDRRRPDADHDGNGILRASYVTLGVGALGTLVGTGFLIGALNSRSGIADYGANCFNSRCSSESEADADRATRRWRAQTTAATASYAIGFAGLITGGILWLLHRDSSARATTVNIADLSLELAPRSSPHGAMLRGTF